MKQPLDFPGAPGKNRTCGLQLRRLSLYPTELRAHGTCLAFPRACCQGTRRLDKARRTRNCLHMASVARNVRGRLAPSPTGYIHLGNAWAFLCAWLAARASEGTVVLRLEDIDPARSRPEFADGLLRDLEWLGLDWDEGPAAGGAFGPYIQSQRFSLYEKTLSRLDAAGYVYPCFCTRKELRSLAGAPHGPEEAPYPGTCRNLTSEMRGKRLAAGKKATLRFHFPKAAEAFYDLIAGRHPPSGEARSNDFALRRSDGVYSYQLAVVADDAAMGINQVVRGNDLLHCTPQQIQLFSALGAQPPEYAHVPLVLDARGERLAKRHHGLEVRALRECGASPAALIGYLAWRGGLMREVADRKSVV